MHQQDAEILKELMLDMVKAIAKVESRLSSIEGNVKEHMRRTAIAEAEIKFLHRQVNLAHGAIALVSFLGVILGVMKGFAG